MTSWQIVLLSAYAFVAGLFLIIGVIQNIQGKVYKGFLPLNLIGAFVWGDAIVFGLFWLVATLLVLAYGTWPIFLLIFLCFWLVRSVGETIYWFNQQFSTIHRNPPHKLWFYFLFKNDSVWFIYQIFWQCVSVTTLVLLLLLWRHL
jgi:hypothetical protein